MVVLLLVLVAEFVGNVSVPLGIAKVVLLSLLDMAGAPATRRRAAPGNQIGCRDGRARVARDPRTLPPGA